MSGWFCKNLGHGEQAYGPITKVHDAFFALSLTGTDSMAVAVFSRDDVGSDTTIIYFSPEAASLAHIVEAAPCTKPIRQGLSLLAGDDRCWGVLFPGE